MFWIGFACGVAAVIATILIGGALWVASLGDSLDDATDEHAEQLGIGSFHGGNE